VALHGVFGPETVSILLSGLHRGRHYQFAAYQAPVPATVRLTATGPVPPATGSGPYDDYLKPNGAVSAVATLTRNASVSAVEVALCQDQRHVSSGGGTPYTAAELENEYEFWAAYYGWSFGVTASEVVTSAGCAA